MDEETLVRPEPQLKETGLAAIMVTGVDLEARKLYLIGDIDENSARNFLIGLDKLNATEEPVTVVINSGGGEEPSGFAIFDSVCQSPCFIIMEGFGAVFSIAAAIYQAADLRRMAPNATFLIHNGSLHVDGDVQQNSIVERAEEIKKNNRRYHSILANASNLSYEDIELACNKDSFYNAEECLKLGFCDEIIQPLKKRTEKKPKKKKKKEA